MELRSIPIMRPLLDEKEAAAAHDTILTGWVTQGPKVKAFESQFAAYCGAEYAVAVSNCTTALHLSLLVAGVLPGDEVICPSMSYIATANSIRHAGATPVFAEVGEDYNLLLSDVVNRITAKTKGILLVHQIGNPADIAGFTQLAKERNLFLIEDAACAIGSEYFGKKIGSHSDLVCFSFHPRKIITTGDGGMITTSRLDYAEKLRLYRQHGMSVNDRVRHESNKVIIEDYLVSGYNYRMTDIQAAIGIEQLAKLPMLIARRRELAARYISKLSKFDCIKLPVEKPGCKVNYQSFAVYLEKNAPVSRNEFMQALLDRGIATRQGIMTAHRTEAYKADYGTIHLPESERLSDNSVLLPLYHQLTEEEQDYIVDVISSILA